MPSETIVTVYQDPPTSSVSKQTKYQSRFCDLSHGCDSPPKSCYWKGHVIKKETYTLVP